MAYDAGAKGYVKFWDGRGEMRNGCGDRVRAMASQQMCGKIFINISVFTR